MQLEQKLVILMITTFFFPNLRLFFHQGVAKTVNVLIPPSDKGLSAIHTPVTFTSDNDIYAFNRNEYSSVTDMKGRRMRYADLVEDGMYTLSGGLLEATRNGAIRAQAEDKVLKLESGLSLCRELGPLSHLHSNVVFHDANGSPLAEFDAVVHVGGQDVPESTAYIVEAQFSPPLTKIDKLLKKADLFSTNLLSLPHYSTVTTVIPVLAGRHWKPDVIKQCISKGIMRLEPSGAGLKLIRLQKRSFSSLPRCLSYQHINKQNI
jgi:hypothetical protein